MNAVFINSNGVGESMYYGPGAGAKPTATAVVSDIITIAKNIRLGTVGYRFNSYKEKTILAKDEDVLGKYYFAIAVPDKKGQLLELTKIFSDANASFEQVVQQKSDGTNARMVAISHTMTKAEFKQIVSEIEQQANFRLLNTFKVLEA
jgi:homoserine dehydrogenase